MRKILLIVLLACGLKVQAQQEAMYTQYMFNQLVLNPAYAGIHDGINASMLWREQWVGFEGAPSTQVISAHSPISSRPISMGVTFLRDKIGVTTNHGLNLAYAYRIPITGKVKLALGLQGNFHNYQTAFNGDALNDPALANANLNIMKINFGTGAMLHSDKFYLGLGVPRIINQKLDPSNPDAQSELVRHYFLTAGYVFPLGKDLMIKPNILWKSAVGAPSQLDINLNVLIKNVFWAGLSYRSLESLDAILKIQISDHFQFGYSFDFYNTNQLQGVQNGSHEFMVSYLFKLPRTKVLSPRYF